jgi:hypothetical protein
MTKDQVARLADAIDNPGKYGVNACLLCNDPKLALVALYVASETVGKRIGQPDSKHRLVLYGLCDTCQHLPDFDEQVERVLVKRMGVH